MIKLGSDAPEDSSNVGRGEANNFWMDEILFWG